MPWSASAHERFVDSEESNSSISMCILIRLI